MFHFAFAEIVELRLPPRILFQIFGDMLGEQNVAGITAVHHPLGYVDSGTGDVGLLIQIGYFVNGAAVNPHADTKLRIVFQRSGNLYGTQDWRFRTIAKDKRTAVARRQTKQLTFCLRQAELLRSTNDFLQRLKLLALLVNE